MFLEIILAGLVAYSASLSARHAASRVNDRVDATTMKLERHISKKIDELHIKLDSNQVRLMRALTWHDYVQTLHVKGAMYKGNNLYMLKEKRIVTTANLATKVVKEVSGSFTLYKSFVEGTEKLYADTHLIYEKLGDGEIKVYDDYGRIYMHTNHEHDTYTYRPDGKTLSIKWSDGAVWYYKYDDRGIVVAVETYNMTPTSKRPPASQAEVMKWRECAQQNSVPECVKACNKEKGGEWDTLMGVIAHDDGCLNYCKSKQTSACGSMPKYHL